MVSEIDKEKVEELKRMIDELFAIYWEEDEIDELGVEFLTFEIEDTLDFMEEDCVKDKKEEIIKLVKMAIEANKEEIPKIFYQLHVQLEKLETCIAELPVPVDAATQESEPTDGSIVNKVDVSNFSTIDVNRIDVNRIDVLR